MPDETIRVAVDVTPFAGPRSGVGHFAVETVAALTRYEPTVTVAPFAVSGRAAVDPRVRGRLPRGTRNRPLPAATAPGWWATTRPLPVDRWLARPDVVHGTNFVVPPTAAPSVASVHDLTFVHRPELCRPEVLRMVPAVRAAVRRGAWVHTLTEAVAAQVRVEFGTDRVRAVAPAAPGLPDSGPRSARIDAIVDGPPYALALGAAEPRKNLPALARAFEQTLAATAGLRLVIAGPPGPDSVRLQPSERVTLAGYVTDAERAALLRQARVLVHAAVDEGFGFPVVEAMHAGVPVVCTDTAVLREVAGDAAEFVAGDWRDAASALTGAAHDGGERTRLVSAGRARAARYTWEATAHGLARLYADVRAAGCGVR